jgi:hypothetical protein
VYGVLGVLALGAGEEGTATVVVCGAAVDVPVLEVRSACAVASPTAQRTPAEATSARRVSERQRAMGRGPLEFSPVPLSISEITCLGGRR